MSSDLKISVIIPAFNAGRYLSEAVNSALLQTLAPFEVIVVDDGSTDDTPGIAASFGSAIRYDRQPHKGTSPTLNRGIELSRGDLIAFLDADDIWEPDKLRNQTAVLQAHPEIDMVFGHGLFFRSPDMNTDVAGRFVIPEEPQPAYIKSAMLIRRNSFLKVGLFDPAWLVGDFIDWYAKSIEAGLKAHMLPETVHKRRVHAHNLTIVQRPKLQDFARILKASLDRRRSAANTNAKSDTNHEPPI
jgi:glycosyltransferase involved in cell wall biosynthesis